jgi:hypothetical protein
MMDGRHVPTNPLGASGDELEYFCAIEVSAIDAIPPETRAITPPASATLSTTVGANFAAR